MPSTKKKAAALRERVKLLETAQVELDRQAEDTAARFIQVVWRRLRRTRLMVEPRRRIATPKGDVHFWRGHEVRERRYRIERYNGSVEYFVPSETQRADGKRFYAEWPDGRVDVFDGPDDNRRCVYSIRPDGCRDHFEGDAGKEVHTRRDMPDAGVVQFFATDKFDGPYVKEQWWPRLGLRRAYQKREGRSGYSSYSETSVLKSELEWERSYGPEKIAALKREYQEAWAPYDQSARAPPERVHPPPEPRPKTPSYAMDGKKKYRGAGKTMLAKSTQKLACKFTGLGEEGLRKMKAYHLDDEMDYCPYYEPPNGFLKLLMGAAMSKQDRTAQTYCLLKDKQQKAKVFCETWVDNEQLHPYDLSDRTIMLRESAKRNLMMIDSALFALRAQVRSEERPDDLGLRVLYERATTAVTLHTKNAKEISRAMNDCFAHMESIDHKKLLWQLRRDYLAATMEQQKNRLLSSGAKDLGLRTVVAWLFLKHRRMLRDEPLSKNACRSAGHIIAGYDQDEDDALKFFEVAMIDDAVAVLWGDHTDKPNQIFWGWSWRSPPKTLEDEISEALEVMKRAITNGLVSRWVIAPAKNTDDVTGERKELLHSEVQLAHDGRWHVVSEPMPAYWLDFFCRGARSTFDITRDAWIGAEFLLTMVTGHGRCLLRDQREPLCEGAWLDVLAYEDVEEISTAAAEDAPDPDEATEDTEEEFGFRLLPNAHIADAMQRIHNGHQTIQSKFCHFTLEKTTMKNGRSKTTKLDRDHLNICPRPGWTLELELECIRGGMLGDHTVIASLPDTLLFLVKYKREQPTKRSLKFPATLDFANYTEALKQGVEPKQYELVGVQEWVLPLANVEAVGLGGRVDLGYIRDTSCDETGQWYAVIDHDYHHFHKPGNAIDEPRLEVCSGISDDGNNSVCSLIVYRGTTNLEQERGVVQWMRKGCAWPEEMETFLAQTTHAQFELFHMASQSARWFEASKNLGSMAAYFNEIYNEDLKDTDSVDVCEIARRIKVLSKIRQGLTYAEFSKALIDTNARIRPPVVSDELLEEMGVAEAEDRRAKRKAKAERAAARAEERAAMDEKVKRLLREAKARLYPPSPPKPTKPPPPPKPTKKEVAKEQRAQERRTAEIQELCKAELEQQRAAAKKAEAEKKAVEDAKREEARKRAEAERIRAEAIALEEAEDAEEAAKQAEEARVQQLRESRATEHLEHAKAQQTKRDPKATGLQRQIAEEAKAAANAEKEAARVAKLAAQQSEAQAVQDAAYANDHDARMAAKAAEVAAKKAAAKAKKEAEKAAKQAKEDAEAVIAEQRRREEQAWAAAQSAPAAAPAPDPTSSAAPADCIICMETKATHVIVPCGHFCLCARCARNQNQCPLCRAPAVHIIQGFF